MVKVMLLVVTQGAMDPPRVPQVEPQCILTTCGSPGAPNCTSVGSQPSRCIVAVGVACERRTEPVGSVCGLTVQQKTRSCGAPMHRTVSFVLLCC